jgi:hypothetical protein
MLDYGIPQLEQEEFIGEYTNWFFTYQINMLWITSLKLYIII